jgi:DNA-directed RNA polymerase subunit RPC12/RpoP
MPLPAEETYMSQKEMRIIPKPPASAVVLEPEAGKLALEGQGSDTYRCGACKTRLMDNVGHMDVYHGDHFDAVKCPKCGKYNGLPHDDHHH